LKILVLSNLFSEEGLLDRLRVISSRDSYDYYLIAGDLLRGPHFEYAEELLNVLPLANTFAVLGNNDPPELAELYDSHGIYVHGKKRKLGDWNLVGLGGGLPSPQPEAFELTEEKMAAILESAGVDEFTILLTHYPPYGIFDIVSGINIGSKSIRAAIDKRKPLMNICGHIKGEGGKQIVGETMVVKVASAYTLHVTEIDLGNKIGVRDILIR